MNKSNQPLQYYIDLLVVMTKKEVKVRYKHAILGFLWIVINPLFQMMVIGLIFSLFVKVSVKNYFLFLLAGLLPWQFFSLSLSKATPSFVHERHLLQKSNFPREVIPLSIIFANFLHLIIAFFLLITFLTFTGLLQLPNLFFLIPASVLLLTFTIGTTLLFASLQVRYRDVNYIVQSLLAIWFYATPIIYNVELIPRNIQAVFSLNPLSIIFELFHLSISGQPLPQSDVVLPNIAIMTLVTMLGLREFRRSNKYFVDWL